MVRTLLRLGEALLLLSSLAVAQIGALLRVAGESIGSEKEGHSEGFLEGKPPCP